jgi:hypothetical protein
MPCARLPALLLAALGAAAACTQFKAGTETAAPEAGPEAGPDAVVAGDAGDAGAADGAAGDAGSVDTGSETGTGDAGSGDDGPTSGCDGALCGIENVLSGLVQAGTIAVDGTNVYVDDQGTATGVVYQCAKTGCAAPTVLGPGFATGIAIDALYVYWNDFSGGKIVRCAIGGCMNAPAVIAPNQPQAEGLSFDGVNLYWAAKGSILTCAAPACGSPSTLATGQTSAIVEMSAEAAVVYWASSGALLGCAAAGCGQKPATITSSVQADGDVFVIDGFAYFTSGNSVASCPVTSPCTQPFTIGSSNGPFGVASDGSHVYWLDEYLAVVYRCPVTGCVGSAEVFADQSSFDPGGEIGTNVALDGEYAYWADAVGVYRKHK